MTEKIVIETFSNQRMAEGVNNGRIVNFKIVTKSDMDFKKRIQTGTNTSLREKMFI